MPEQPPPPEPDGPHNLPHSQQDRVTVTGRLLDGGGPCTVILIRDPKHAGWVLYPHGMTGMAVRITHGEALRVAQQITGEDS